MYNFYNSWSPRNLNPRFILLFILFCVSICFIGNITLQAQEVLLPVSEVASSDVATITSNVSILSHMIALQGQDRLSDWLISNWYFLILSVIGLARALILITPTPKDNRVWNRYLVSPIKVVLSILSLSKPK